MFLIYKNTKWSTDERRSVFGYIIIQTLVFSKITSEMLRNFEPLMQSFHYLTVNPLLNVPSMPHYRNTSA